MLPVLLLLNGATACSPLLTAILTLPDDDSFWKAAEAKGFTVRRGYLGSGSRFKQDDAFLIAEIVETRSPAAIALNSPESRRSGTH